jgi:hypothetical protein
LGNAITVFAHAIKYNICSGIYIPKVTAQVLQLRKIKSSSFLIDQYSNPISESIFPLLGGGA